MTLSLGYKLSSEEQSLVRQAQMAEDCGFAFALISDHFHPWTDRQGQSPFVAIVAQAAATAAALMPGRFFLGVGTGENLNEHIVGSGWPETEVRQQRLEEAIEVGAAQAARLGDGMIATEPERSLMAAFDDAGGAGKPRYGEPTVCWAKDEATGRRIAREQWPTSAMESSLSWELPLPAHFEAVAELVTEDQVAEAVTCGPDPAKHLAAIRKYAEAGYDHVCVHQVGKDQKGFFEFYEQEILPELMKIRPARKRSRRRRRG